MRPGSPGGIEAIGLSGRALWTLALPAHRVAIADDGSWIAAAGVTDACFLDPASGARREALVTGSDPRALVALGDLLIGCDFHGTVQAWDLATRAERDRREAGAGVACACADGARVLLGCADGTVRTWAPGAAVERLGKLEHPQQVSGIARAPGLAITSSLAKSLRVSRADTGERVATLEGLRAMPWCMSGSPDGTRVAVAVGHSIQIHEVPSLRLVTTWKVHRAVVSALTWSTAALWSGAEDGTAVRHGEDGRVELSLAGRGEVRSIATGGALACIARAVGRH